MRPQRGRDHEPDLDPTVEALVRDLMGAVDDLRTARIQLDNLDVAEILHERTVVTEDFMSALADAEGASPALREYAARVRAGECRWPDIEYLARPIPPEVGDLEASPNYIWPWSHTTPAPPDPTSRPTPGGNVVGPSDWPDDLDEYPTEKPWWIT
ncbi:hypothetical protein [Nocardia sp. NPDC051570]|uniref:hypothetical protein n=1 Tax=Nocardia sp. NPDC051570 TaxID=3364324 RepID=UPI0037A8E126